MAASRGGYRTSRSSVTPGRASAAPRATPTAPPTASPTAPPTATVAAPWVLLRAAHGGPTVAVTTLVAVLAAGRGVGWGTALLLAGAVLAGQLTIGWVNDLVDLRRDREVGRTDKPLATGELPVGVVHTALALAAVAAVGLSLALGWRSALVHLVLVVGSGQAYNLGLKATAWSWLPYAVAFGTLPAVVTLAGAAPTWPELWLMVAAGTLGVAAHFLNVVPDLADDAATGVRGLPHRIGETGSRVAATTLLVTASVAALLGRDGSPEPWGWVLLVLVLGLAAVSLRGRGRSPFRAAVAIALVDVVLVAAG